MESPVIVDKPPEYYGRKKNDCDKSSGFPFEEDSGSGSEDVWNDLASRHPDIAARIRAGRDGTWGGRKRRSSQQPDDFSRNVDEHFHGFPFDDIPPEFRQHFPSRWGDRFAQRSPQEPKHRPREKEVNAETSPAQTSKQEIATQTSEDPPLCTEASPTRAAGIPHYGLRNTVDLGQKTPAEPRSSQRSMSAPPDNRPDHHKQQMPPPQQMQQPQPQQMQQPPQQMHQPQPQPQQTQPQQHQQQQQQPNVRHIPIFVEGRDEPVVNKNPTTAPNHNPEPREASPQPPEREMHIPFSQPSHFSKAFGAPFKGFKPQPFGQRPRWDDREIPKVFKPTSKSPPPQQQPQQQPQQHQQQPQQQQPQQQPRPKTEEPPLREASPQPPKPPSPADPIVKIQLIQKDVLDLMTQVEKFQGHGRKDKHYLYLDEMLTRNLIKLDDIDTDGKENIRQARREAIKCIQKCIAVLEAKADAPVNAEMGPDAEMTEAKDQNEQTELRNGEVEDNPPSVAAPMEVDQPSQQ